jgi:NAD(P)-dependent dehydrogenase (short-subunit alcohol dehydrogenase family)
MNLEGRTIVVTGAASGIGEATAKLARTGGARVVALDCNVPPDADESWVEVDLADAASIAGAVARLPDHIDALCNVAGIPGTLPAHIVLAVNLLGLRELTERVIAQRPTVTSIVHVASTAGVGWPGLLGSIDELLQTASIDDGLAWWTDSGLDEPAYNFSKAALIVYGMRSAWYQHGEGRRVNLVSPGPTETPILPAFRASMGEELLDGVFALTGRNGQPDEVAEVICFLAGATSTWVNGANVIVDGGFAAAVASGSVDIASMTTEE